MATPRKAAAKKAAATKKSPAKKAPAARKAPAKKGAAKKTAKKQQPSVRSAAGKARGAAEDISFVAKSKVKDVLKQLDMRTDSELVHEVNRRVREMLEGAADRAKGNKRSTVRPHDL